MACGSSHLGPGPPGCVLLISRRCPMQRLLLLLLLLRNRRRHLPFLARRHVCSVRAYSCRHRERDVNDVSAGASWLAASFLMSCVRRLMTHQLSLPALLQREMPHRPPSAAPAPHPIWRHSPAVAGRPSQRAQRRGEPFSCLAAALFLTTGRELADSPLSLARTQR